VRDLRSRCGRTAARNQRHRRRRPARSRECWSGNGHSRSAAGVGQMAAQGRESAELNGSDDRCSSAGTDLWGDPQRRHSGRL